MEFPNDISKVLEVGLQLEFFPFGQLGEGLLDVLVRDAHEAEIFYLREDLLVQEAVKVLERLFEGDAVGDVFVERDFQEVELFLFVLQKVEFIRLDKDLIRVDFLSLIAVIRRPVHFNDNTLRRDDHLPVILLEVLHLDLLTIKSDENIGHVCRLFGGLLLRLVFRHLSFFKLNRRVIG
jgi:hypothetical protein